VRPKGAKLTDLVAPAHLDGAGAAAAGTGRSPPADAENSEKQYVIQRAGNFGLSVDPVATRPGTAFARVKVGLAQNAIPRPYRDFLHAEETIMRCLYDPTLDTDGYANCVLDSADDHEPYGYASPNLGIQEQPRLQLIASEAIELRSPDFERVIEAQILSDSSMVGC
jgi:hypothetical protein